MMGNGLSNLKTVQPVVLNSRIRRTTSVPHVVSSSSNQPAQKDPLSLAADLERVMNHIKSDFLSADGRFVDYVGMMTSATFDEFQDLAEELCDIKLETLDETARKSFFINLYNLLTIHGLISVQKDKPERWAESQSVLQMDNFWRTMAYQIGELVFTLDDIEHGILRANRPHPMKALFTKKHFPKDDGRAAFSLTSCDPRIHFCLNCGAESCPRINVLQVKRDPDLLERSLKKAAQSYCDDDANVQIDPDKNEIRLSKIFDWYAVDFGVRKQSDLPVQVNMIADWLTDKRRAALMRQLIVAKKTKVIFLPYNWQLNALKKASTQ